LEKSQEPPLRKKLRLDKEESNELNLGNNVDSISQYESVANKQSPGTTYEQVEDRASQYFLGGGTPAKNEFTEKFEIYVVSSEPWAQPDVVH